MENLNSVVSQNIIKYRKRANLTQLELSEKLNYSDKAVSKWERGESLPDVSVLKQMADLFGVTMNDLCYEEKKKSNIVPETKLSKHFYVSILSVGLVWLVATIVFVALLVFAPSIDKKWLCFIYALPVSSIVAIVFNSIWGKKLINCILVSILIWTIIVSVCLTASGSSINWLYLLGIPLQILTIIWYFFKGQVIEKLHAKRKAK